MRKILAIMLGSILIASGYARAQGTVLPLPAEDQQEINRMLGAGVVGQALPSLTIQHSSLYFPLRDKTLTYQVATGDKAGRVEQLGVAKVRRPAGKSAWRFQLSPSLSGFIRETTEGDLIMPAVADAGEGVVVVTTPANPFVLKGMKPGETRSYSQHVSVSHLDDPSDQEYSGNLNGTYTYVGTYQLTVPAGTYQAVLLRTKCNGRVGPAETQDSAYYFFAPNVGVVAMISQEDATAFWLIHLDSKTGKVLSNSN
ncbi:MAG TPA: hypothetical protein VMA09_21500 [Candidatus Binataceae bacterium]|nr:hypothetical protein [Candidatus Binataceae bacterium]